MPRLTAKQYLQTHDRLRRLYLHDSKVFAELSPMEQWKLHDHFQPSKDWSDLQLLQHRDRITQERPSLPHQAGRVLATFWEKAAAYGLRRTQPAGPRKRVKQADRQFTIKAEVRPEVDAQKLARAFIWLALERAKLDTK